MIEQLDLLSATPPAVRTTDPSTSHVALAQVRAQLPTQRAAVLADLVQHGVATAAEVARRLDRQQNVMSKRLGELVAAGLAEVCGVRTDRRPLQEYRATPAGRTAASELWPECETCGADVVLGEDAHERFDGTVLHVTCARHCQECPP